MSKEGKIGPQSKALSLLCPSQARTLWTRRPDMSLSEGWLRHTPCRFLKATCALSLSTCLIWLPCRDAYTPVSPSGLDLSPSLHEPVAIWPRPNNTLSPSLYGYVAISGFLPETTCFLTKFSAYTQDLFKYDIYCVSCMSWVWSLHDCYLMT